MLPKQFVCISVLTSSMPWKPLAIGRSQWTLHLGYSRWHSDKVFWASLVAQMVKNLPAMWETWVLALGWEDPLEKGRATHSSILAWRIPWTEEPGRLQSMELQRVRYY